MAPPTSSSTKCPATEAHLPAFPRLPASTPPSSRPTNIGLPMSTPTPTSRPPSSQKDLLNLGFERTVLRHRVQRQFRIAGNDSQEIVEVVSYTAGEVSDCVHLLGLQKLRFQPQPLGEVTPV